MNSKENPNMGFCIAAIFISVLIFFVTLEIFSRVLLSNAKVFYRIKGSDSSSGRLEWVRHHQGNATFTYDFDVYHPTRGWTLAPNIKNKMTFGNKVLNSNSRGIRGKKEYSYEKSPKKIRILTIGDSFTFGEEVADHETFQSYLERLAPQLEVINLGVHGYGHDQMLLYLKEEGLKYKPDIILLGFLYYDMERNMSSFFYSAKPHFAWDGANLHLKGVPVPSPEAVVRAEFSKLKMVDLAKIIFEKWRLKNGASFKKMKALGFALMNEIAKLSVENGAQPVFVYFVNESDFVHYFDERSDREKVFFDFCDQNKAVFCTSTRPAFLKELKNGIAVDTYGHWDRRGQLIASLSIYDFLKEKNLLNRS